MTLRVNNLLFWSVLSGFVGGVGIRSFISISYIEVFFFIFIALVLVLLLFIRKPNSWEVYISLILLLTSFSLGILRTDVRDKDYSQEMANAVLSQEALLLGVIKSDPVSRDGRQDFILELLTIDEGDLPTPTKVRVFADIYPELDYGDEISMIGKLAFPENFSSESGRDFNYVKYLAKDKIAYQLFYPKDLTVLGRGKASDIKRGLFALKAWFVDALTGIMPDPHASLMAGITVGADEGLGKQMEEDFRNTGIIHIVVLSGYNVTIIAEMMLRLLVFVPLLARSLFAGSSIILFAILTGATATIVRASIMALLVILARFLRRPQHVARALALAGVVMLVHNPFILAFDPSFQLSFLATVGLIYFFPLVEHRLLFLTTKWGLRDLVTATISTQLFVLPAILYMMGTLSLVSVPVNALVLPLIPVSMLSGFITALATLAGHTFAMPFALLSSILAEYSFIIVDIFASLPFGTLNISNFPFILVLCIYVFYAVVIWRNNKKPAIDFSMEWV